jgi:uncharacterized membrane protein
MKKLFNYFLKGLLLIVPIFLSCYILLLGITWVDNIIPLEIPGLGLAIIISATTFFGYVATFLFLEPLLLSAEKFIGKIPLVNIIYSSLKDFTAAFVGDKKKFNKAVLVVMNKNTNLMKPGFITSEDLANIGLPGMVVVYFPHSYNFSGNIFIVESQNVKQIYSSSADVMKFIVSGGISGSINMNK